jgi:iron complex transport system substrate-binding protein
MFPPERIVCLTEETVETLYLLGGQDRIVGISGYCVRPPQARREKPRVSAFISADIPKILNLRPDLVLSFSDLQGEIVAALVRQGISVHAFNQRSLEEIFDMIRMLGAMVDAADRADRLAEELAAELRAARQQAAQRRPRVCFEEWDDPMISGIAWVSELIEAVGGIDIFDDRASGKSAKDRLVTIDEVIARDSEVNHRLVVRQEISAREVSGATGVCSGPSDPARRTSGNQVGYPATGPAALTHGLRALQNAIHR